MELVKGNFFSARARLTGADLGVSARGQLAQDSTCAEWVAWVGSCRSIFPPSTSGLQRCGPESRQAAPGQALPQGAMLVTTAPRSTSAQADKGSRR